MSSATMTKKELLLSSIKSMDTEEKVDLFVFRPLGLKIALFAKKHGITPNPITITSIFAGVGAGHLFYYENIYLNILGVLLLSLGSTLDSADGQLARMTNQCSQFGRILDGIAGYLWFVSIYLHLIVRFYPQNYDHYILVMIGLGVLSHSFQSGIADYYRNAHLSIVYGKGELERSIDLKNKYYADKSGMSFFSKIFAIFYINYTVQQESLTKNFQQLKEYFISEPEARNNEKAISAYRKFSKPLQKYCNGLTLNSRFFVIYLSLFLNEIYIYLCYEVIVLNLIAIYMISEHEYESRKLYSQLLKK